MNVNVEIKALNDSYKNTEFVTVMERGDQTAVDEICAKFEARLREVTDTPKVSAPVKKEPTKKKSKNKSDSE